MGIPVSINLNALEFMSQGEKRIQQLGPFKVVTFSNAFFIAMEISWRNASLISVEPSWFGALWDCWNLPLSTYS